MSGRPPLPIPGQAPSLPARRPPPPPRPASPAEEYYSEFHGDAEIQSDSPPPPPPPRPGPPPVPPTSDEIYDDFEEGEEHPPPADFSQDVYEATDEVSPPPPPPPSSRPPPAIPSSGGAPPLPPGRFEPQEEVYADPDEQPQVYEAVEETPAPPPIPPNRTKRDPLPPPEMPASRPEPKPAPKVGLMIDANSLASTLGNLRKTNAKPLEKNTTDKVYTDNSSFDQKKQLFGQALRSPPLPPLKPSKGSAESKGTVEVKKLPFQGFGALKPVGPKPPPKVDKEESSSAGKPWMQEKKEELPPPVASPPSRKITPPAPIPPGRKSPVMPDSPGSDGSEELYDDGSSFQIMDPLIGNSWYFPKIERKEAEKQLNKHLGEDGTFLVRKSSRDPMKPYTIDVVYQRRIYHLQVRQRSDKNFALGSAKDDEMHFKDVKELVEHHKKKEVILIGDHPGSVLLKKSP